MSRPPTWETVTGGSSTHRGSPVTTIYRGVAEAVYGDTPHFEVDDKVGTLRRLKGDGFWLIDAVEHPINKASRSARRGEVEKATDRLPERCLELAPQVGVPSGYPMNTISSIASSSPSRSSLRHS